MNKKQIERLRKELELERQELLEEVQRMKERENSYLNDTVGDDIDRAAGNSQREILFFLSDHDRHRLDAIEDALNKIDSGRYGVCEKCGKKIKNARLQAIPYARLCIKCKPTSENQF